MPIGLPACSAPVYQPQSGLQDRLILWQDALQLIAASPLLSRQQRSEPIHMVPDAALHASEPGGGLPGPSTGHRAGRGAHHPLPSWAHPAAGAHAPGRGGQGGAGGGHSQPRAPEPSRWRLLPWHAHPAPQAGGPQAGRSTAGWDPVTLHRAWVPGGPYAPNIS